MAREAWEGDPETYETPEEVLVEGLRRTREEEPPLALILIAYYDPPNGPYRHTCIRSAGAKDMLTLGMLEMAKNVVLHAVLPNTAEEDGD